VFLGIKAVEYKDKFDNHLVPGPRYSAEHLHGPHGEALTADTARHSELFFALYFGLTGHSCRGGNDRDRRKVEQHAYRKARVVGAAAPR